MKFQISKKLPTILKIMIMNKKKYGWYGKLLFDDLMDRKWTPSCIVTNEFFYESSDGYYKLNNFCLRYKKEDFCIVFNIHGYIIYSKNSLHGFSSSNGMDGINLYCWNDGRLR